MQGDSEITTPKAENVSMSMDSLNRGIRAKKEDYILSLVKANGKIRATELYGAFSRRFQGAAIRTYLNEYLTALEYRGQVVLRTDGNGYWAYEPTVFEREQGEKIDAESRV